MEPEIDWARDDNKHFGKEKDCNEVGLVSNPFTGCRMEPMFRDLFCTRKCFHKVFNEPRNLRNELNERRGHDRFILRHFRKREFSFFGEYLDVNYFRIHGATKS